MSPSEPPPSSDVLGSEHDWNEVTPSHSERAREAELDEFFGALPEDSDDSEPPPTLASWTRQLPPPLPDPEH